MRFGWLSGPLVLGVLALPAAPASPAGTTSSAPVHYHEQIAVLTYHDVSPTVPRGTDTVSPQEFAAEITLMLSEGFHFVSVPELEAFVAGGAAAPPNAVCVVFDNGYAGIYKYALPVLEQHHIPAAVWAIAFREGCAPLAPERVARYKSLMNEYARQPMRWKKKLRYQLGRWLCGRGPFAPYLDQDRWETECRT